MFSLSVGLASPDSELLAELEGALVEAGCKTISKTTEVHPSAIQKLVEQQAPDVVVLDFRAIDKPWDVLVGALKAAAPRLLLIALYDSASPADILESIRSGADEYVYPPYTINLLKSLGRLEIQRRESTASGQLGQLLVFVSVKGGCGATVLATQCAGWLSQLNRQRTLLLDLDLELGLAAFLTKHRQVYSSVDALNNVHRLDWSYWQALVTGLNEFWDFLAAPPAQELHVRPPLDNFKKIIRFARSHYQWVVIDAGRGFNELVVLAFEEGAQIYVVTTAELAALYQLKRFREAAEQYGVQPEQFHVILNRYRRDAEISVFEIEQMTGIKLFAVVSEDLQAVWEICAEGGLARDTSPLARQLKAVVSKITGKEMSQQPRKRFLLFG